MFHAYAEFDTCDLSAFDTVGLLGRELGLVYNLARLTLSLADPKKVPFGFEERRLILIV